MKSFAWLAMACALVVGGTTLLSVPARASVSAPAGASAVHIVLPGQSIQAAVDAASPGDTIQLEPGVYRESVTITTNDITLRGAGSGPGGTLLMPPATLPDNFCAQVPPDPGTHGGGICVFGAFDPVTGTLTSHVTGVRVTGIQLADWPGDGVGAFGTDHLRVDHVTVTGTGVYGVAVLASTYGLVDHNTITGIQAAGGAGILLGVLPDSHVAVTGNDVSNAKTGIHMYDVGDVTLTGNTSHGNCQGMAVIDDNLPQDGLPADYGNILIAGNRLIANNAVCPAVPAARQPVTQGSGLLMVGTSRTVVSGNTITGNAGDSSTSGGILLSSGTPAGGPDESDDAIVGNFVRGNQPGDLMWDQQGSAIEFAGNSCQVSSPGGLCAGG